MVNAGKNVAPWSTLAGSTAAIVGLAQSQLWLALLGISLSAASAFGDLYLHRKRHGRSAGITIEGLNLDALYLANLRRRTNSSIELQRAFQVAIIDEADLNLAWQYEGQCRSESETAIEFSIDSEHPVPFDALDCFAFDLKNDPQRIQRIRPALIGSDGSSKKVRVSFLKPLALGEPFSVLLHCNLPGCINTGVQYYTSTVSFEQRSIESSGVHLMFVKARPRWMRVYDVLKNGQARFVSELRPIRDDGVTCEYIDIAQNISGQSIRVYLYDLPALGGLTSTLRRVGAAGAT
jgi:hypothetical protein